MEINNEACIYFDEWLSIWNAIPKERKTNWQYARLVSSTLSELLVIDALEAGL